MKKILYIYLLLSLSFSFAQKKGVKKEEKVTTTPLPKESAKLKKSADLLIERRSYYSAIDTYLQLYKIHSDNEDIVYSLGKTYYLTRDYTNSEKFFKEYRSNKNFKKYTDVSFYLGEVLKSQGKYQEAQTFYDEFTRTRHKALTDKNLPKYAKNEVSAIEWVKTKIKEDSLDVDFNRILSKMNSAYSDFSPYPLGNDTLIFASLQKDSILTHNYEDHHFHGIKLYEIVKKDEQTWGDPEELDEFNHEYEHTANGVVSPDGKYFYFTRCLPDETQKVTCDIYYTPHDKNKIKEDKVIKAKGINMDGYSTTQPTFLTTTKKGKKGETLYQYSLIFSSDRPGGKGGKDLWIAPMEAHGKFKKPANLGPVINTIKDEITPYYNNKEQLLFFSSNYHFGFGGLDIFKASGTVNRWSQPENAGIPLNSSYDDSYFIPVTGKYNEDETGYLVSNRPGGIALHSATCCDDIYHFKEIPSKTVTFSGSVVENIYQKIDQKDTTSLSDTTKMVISSKNDNTSALISSNKVEGVQVGYFRKKLYEDAVARKDSSFSSLEEFVTWADTSNKSGGFSFTLKEGKPYVIMTKKVGYKNKVHFVTATNNSTDLPIEKKSKADTSTIKIAQKTFNENIESSSLKNDEKYVLNQVRFETNSAILRKEAIDQLEKLFTFLDKNKNVKIEVEGHTDSKGTEEHNLDLSQRRADAIALFLTTKGIEEKRITSKGFGESMPLLPNENADGTDNPENRALNRRTEFKIIDLKK